MSKNNKSNEPEIKPREDTKNKIIKILKIVDLSLSIISKLYNLLKDIS